MRSISLIPASSGHARRFVDQLASLPGFVCFGTPFPGASRPEPGWLAAHPIRSIAFPAWDKTSISAAVRNALAESGANTRVAGIVDYNAAYGLEEALVQTPAEKPSEPVRTALYSWWISWEPDTQALQLCLTDDCQADVQPWLEALFREARLPDSAVGLNPAFPLGFTAGDFVPEVSRDDYLAGVLRVQDYILSGDCYQVNLSHRYKAPYSGSLWAAFAALCEQFPSPHSGFIAIGEETVLSISPESFLEIAGGRIRTRPIKGTRPRGVDAFEDKALAAELLASEKDRAENVMIVDLLRNDLGRFSEVGSVTVDALAVLESYRNVHHLVSTVSSNLRADVHPFDAFLGCFPGGSITGAPKIRAMQIIAELEASPRGPYCGSLFWLDGSGRLYSNIAIRTLYGRDGRLYCHGGGGIVADSDPGAEYQETLDKVGPLMAALSRIGDK